MSGHRIELRSQVFRDVLGYTLRHWGGQPGRIAGIVLLVLLSAGADVLVPLYAGRLVEAVASSAPGDAIAREAAWTAFAIVLALGLTRAVLRQFVFHNIITLTLRMMGRIAQDAFGRVQRLSTDWHANSFAGSTVRKITRGVWALDLLNDTLLIALLPAAVMLVGATVMLGMSWPIMGVVVGVGAVLYLGVTVVMSLAYVAPAARLANAWDTRLGGALSDAISCNAVVKAFGAEKREEARLSRVIDKWQSRTRRTWVRGTINGGVQAAMLIGMQAGLLGVSLYLWQTGQANAGDITLALSMFFILQSYLRDIGMHIRNLQRSVNDMEELVALEHLPPGIADAVTARAPQLARGEIRFNDVTFRYGQHPVALFSRLNVRIAPGERVGLVGPSGSGKTTFVKLIQRLYDVTGGSVTLDGEDVRELQQAAMRRQIAIVPQEPVLFHRSLAENIAYGRPGATREEVEAAARLASAHDFIARLPGGYETLVGERGVKLSGGERQRVAIARAFLADAPILILDEATSSLDSESETLIQAAMQRLMQGRTTLVIAHRLSTVRELDRLLVFEKGQVIESGTHAELIARPDGVYRRLLQHQAEGMQLGEADEAALLADQDAEASSASGLAAPRPTVIFLGT
ncbi:ABC transporter ATP-binding protein [Achromobacter sp. GG226]|uniref:ABC transporter ATP-binding protein n=1 Tax=Verticiella alkaliphila TaxID=2779529 RepID=UPI001C0E1CCB|nr:ABC transporter ATP-binding protein [Verticiella sp. GG226]MBU4609803.1 ABC transporter ATP-binding protein [Verticiella sp. GG226]